MQLSAQFRDKKNHKFLFSPNPALLLQRVTRRRVCPDCVKYTIKVGTEMSNSYLLTVRAREHFLTSTDSENAW